MPGIFPDESKMARYENSTYTLARVINLSLI
jgi:hypothetical protein